MGTITFPLFFFKTAAEVLAFPLTVLSNYALLLGLFSDSLKIAKVIPIHKDNSKSIIDLFQYCKQFLKYLRSESIPERYLFLWNIQF